MRSTDSRRPPSSRRSAGRSGRIRRLRVLLLTHPDLVPPVRAARSVREAFAVKTESDVITTLRASGHAVHVLGVQWALAPLQEALERLRPDLVFNLLEEFHGETTYDHHIVSYLELQRIPYTGCSPRGLVLARGKAIGKILAAHEGIRVPRFAVFPRGQRVHRPRTLPFPLIVKSLTADASLGIAKTSVVETEAKLAARVRFIHERIGHDAIAEEFIIGRELSVSVLGNDRLRTFPPWELRQTSLAAEAPLIATERLKHDPVYQERTGVVIGPATDLPEAIAATLLRDSRRIYRRLELSGYARIDFRLDAEGHSYFLEANPNPDIAAQEEFAQSAAADGMTYPALLDRILQLGRRRVP